MAGKPFPKVSPEQRAAFDAALKRDGLKLLKDLGRAAGRAAVDHARENPDSVIVQTVGAIERDTGVVTVIARGVATIVRERQAKAQVQQSQADNVVDAEFVDEPK
jgi:hypothetical protein